jgi:hypothetical protein
MFTANKSYYEHFLFSARYLLNFGHTFLSLREINRAWFNHGEILV